MLAHSKPQVTDYIHYIIDNEGEGIILRKPHSSYEPGRTETLLKLKVSLNRTLYLCGSYILIGSKE